MKKLKYLIENTYFFLLGGIIAKFLYSAEYRKTKYFSHPSAPGYKWAVYDLWNRMTTGKNKNVPWPVAPGTDVPHPENICFPPEELKIFSGTGIYFQGIGAKTIIGNGCWIARNVGLITCNHDINDPDKHSQGKDIVLGDGC